LSTYRWRRALFKNDCAARGYDQAYFRLYRKDRPAGREGTRPEALADIWLELEGMRATVREARQHAAAKL
jgi:hypothetical protein